jgi:hypothetical protein
MCHGQILRFMCSHKFLDGHQSIHRDMPCDNQSW